VSTSSTPPASIEHADVRHPLFARLYHYVLGREGKRMARHRRRLLEGLNGTVVEIGPGNGPSFRFYPTTVSKVIAVEPEPYLRQRASETAREASIPIEVVAGTAGALPLEDATADAVLFILVLCTVPDQQRALAEARRVLKPGGELRIFEHVGAHPPAAQALLKAAEATFWTRAFGGCHPTRHTLAAIERAGFDVSGVRRLVMQASPIEPPLPYILGTAHPTHQAAAQRQSTLVHD
jgi:ubiquinone/menaquinone biosynthesis C-methylase UbiE